MAKTTIMAKIITLMLIVSLGALVVMGIIAFNGMNNIKDSSVMISSAALEEKAQAELIGIVEGQAELSESMFGGIKQLVVAAAAQVEDYYANPDLYVSVPSKLSGSFENDETALAAGIPMEDLVFSEEHGAKISYEHMIIYGAPGSEVRYDESFKVVSDDPSLQKEIDTVSPLSNYMKNSFIQHDSPVWLYFGSAKGLFFNSPGNGPMPEGYDNRVRDWYLGAEEKGGFGWTEPYMDASGAGLMISASAPAYSKSGNLLGVFAADVTINTINQQVINLKIGETGYAYLIDENGNVIAKPDLQAGDTKWDESFDSESMLETGNEALTAVTKRMISGEKGTAKVNFNGEEKYVVFAPIPELGWSLAGVLPVEEAVREASLMKSSIEEQTRNTLTSIVIAIIILIIVIVVISVSFAKSLTRPISKLKAVIDKIIGGDIEARLDVKSNDEIGELAQSFAMMQESVLAVRKAAKKK